MVYTPGQPDDPHQPRPALVISENVRNRLRDHLIVIPAFSTGKPGPTRVPLPAGVGGLNRPCVLFCEEVTTIDRDFIRRGPLGQPIPPPILSAVVLATRRAIGDFVING